MIAAVRFSNGLAGLTLLAAAGSTQAQDLTHRAPPQSGPIVIAHATVHSMDGPVIEKDGWVAFDNGIITGVGSGAPQASGAAKVIDAAGLHVYPGLISAYTQLGLTEIQSVRASTDMSETGAVKPEVYAAVSVNPDSTLIPVTRSNGVLVAGVFPTGGSIPGRASVMRLEGWTWEDMALERDAGVVIAWPVMRPISAPWMDKGEEEQVKDIKRNVEVIEGAFRQAAAYVAARKADPAVPVDIRWEALSLVLPDTEKKTEDMPTQSRGHATHSAQRPVFIEATDYDQIVAAVSFAGRWGLRCTIIGGRDAPLCAELLKRHDVAVIVPGTLRLPRRDDSAVDEAYTLPARLEAAGIRWCLSGGDDTAHERNLPYNAAMAVAYGLDHEAAIRGITKNAAEILGVGGRVGTITAGKEATIILTDGDPLEVTTHVVRAFITGREIDLSNKQTELEKKYRERYRGGGGAAGSSAAAGGN